MFKSLMASMNREERERIGGGSSHLTIYFTIKDRTSFTKSSRKDSLLEFAQKRGRTHSQTVDFISAQSLNHIVQQLLDVEFAVFKESEKKFDKKSGKAASPKALTKEK